MSDKNHEHDDDVEEFSYHCFDDCENYPDGCATCDQVMHKGFGPQDKDKPKPKTKA